MKTIVRVPYCLARSASAITCLISLMPVSTAENSMNSALVMWAMICASVVLQVPGGPQTMREPMSSRSIWVRRGLPGPTRCSWPMNSSSVRGRMRSARGRVRSPGLSLGMVGNRFMMASVASKSMNHEAHVVSRRKPLEAIRALMLYLRVPLCPLWLTPLPCDFIQHDTRRHAHIQRIDLRGLRNGNDLIHGFDEVAGYSRTFAAKKNCQRAGEIRLIEVSAFVRCGGHQSKAGRFHAVQGVGEVRSRQRQ